MKWRPTLIALHRDVGYLALGLTLVYAVSGIAVNHREHWDYNYVKERELREVGRPADLLNGHARAGDDDLEPGVLARRRKDEVVTRLVEVLGRETAPRRSFWRGRDRLSLFFGEADTDIVDYLPSKGLVEHEVKRDRFLVRAMNFLHLNEARRVWTWVADLFAVSLIFLGITGAVVVRGRKGLKGRGGLLTLAGIALPLLAYLILAG